MSTADGTDMRRVLEAYHTAMVEARVEDLARLVADDFSLVHITGYVQPKDEWFDVIRRGEFDYHAIDLDEKSLSFTPKGDGALVAGRGVFDATINGMRRPWRLQFSMQLVRRETRWIVAHARYTTF